MASEIRVCKCGKKVPSIRRSDFCSSACRESEKAKVLKADGLVLVHSCLSDAKHDQFVVGCICRKTVSREDSFDLIKKGECISLTTREYQFDGGPIIYVGGHSKTPRAATIEANHILYGVGSMAPSSKKKRKTETRSIEELLKLRDEERASLAEEARCRWEEFHRLDTEMRQSLIREIPAEEYDSTRRNQWGRQWFGSVGINSERTEGGVGVDARRET
jgi:hypothetical protein